jgi:hypothetical protein
MTDTTTPEVKPTANEPKLTPTARLILEVLAARHRLGESHWTFDSVNAKTLGSLEAAGLVSLLSTQVQGTTRARLTEAGKEQALDAAYVTPVTMEVRNALGLWLEEWRRTCGDTLPYKGVHLDDVARTVLYAARGGSH